MAVLKGDADKVPDLRWQLDEIIIDGNRIGARLTNFGKPAKAWLGVPATAKTVQSKRLERGGFDGRHAHRQHAFPDRTLPYASDQTPDERTAEILHQIADEGEADIDRVLRRPTAFANNWAVQ